jgi:EmrB/QacA subfamily drug resistance transporter
MFLATVNSGTLLIALPTLERALGTSLLTLVWVILAYMVATTVLMLPAGRLADQFGRKRLWIVGLVVFGLTSLGAGFAESGTQLIIWRIVQGVGAALLFANAGALVTDVFPREKLGLAMGTNVMVAAAGLVIGPVLGGWLVTFGWAWVFWFNVPLAAIGIVWSLMVLHETARLDHEQQMDWWGNLLLIVGLTGLVYGLSDAGIAGWTDRLVVVSIVVGVACLVLFVWVESRVAVPLLDLGLFRIRIYSYAAIGAFLNGVTRFALEFLFVFYFQGPQQQDPITAGVMLAPLAIGMLIASPLAGAWADRKGSRVPATLGMLICAAGLAGMTTLEVASPYWQSAIWLGIVGAGSGIFNSPNTSAVMGVVPPNKRGAGAGTRMMLMQSGFVVSIALAIGLVSASMDPKVLVAVFSGTQIGGNGISLTPFINALHMAFLAGVVASALGAVASLMRGEHRSYEGAGEPVRLEREQAT